MKGLRYNVRGVMRDDSLWIAQVSAYSFANLMNASARALMGVASAAGVDSSQSVRVCKLADLSSSEINNLMVGELPVHSIVALVKGTQDTDLLPVQQGFDSTRALQSRAVKCVLGEQSSRTFNLMAYCHENQLLVYKLDDETAVVLISAVIVEEDKSWTLVVDRMQKVKDRDIDAVTKGLLSELEISPDVHLNLSGEPVVAAAVAKDVRGLKRARVITQWPSSPSKTS